MSSTASDVGGNSRSFRFVLLLCASRVVEGLGKPYK